MAQQPDYVHLTAHATARAREHGLKAQVLEEVVNSAIGRLKRSKGGRSLTPSELAGRLNRYVDDAVSEVSRSLEELMEERFMLAKGELELAVDPGDASLEELRAVLHAMNEVQMAAGGLGLEFTVDGLFVIARQEVPQ